MAIRIRRINGRLIAICAARSMEKPGDLYLDDEMHHALAIKFDLDFMGEPWAADTPEVALMEQEESNNPARTWWDSVYDPKEHHESQ